MNQRKIIHVDMDAFYASVEQLDQPELKGKPIVVGGGGPRGVVAAASYEARKYGVRSAMSGQLARKKCPHLIFLPGRYERYKAISKQVRQIFKQYTELIEPLSLDEAYLDVTNNKLNFESATQLATKIRQQIYDETGLTASAGISINKFLAKVASDINKPNGQKTIPPSDVLPFLSELDIQKFHGIGKVTAQKMFNLKIFTGYDLRQKSIEFLTEHFGKSGPYYYDVVRGIHRSEVKPNRLSKSISTESTFTENISSELYLIEEIQKLCNQLIKRTKRMDVKGRTLVLKIKYSDFTQQTRSKTFENYIEQSAFFNIAKSLIYQDEIKESVRLLGIGISNLNKIKTSNINQKIEMQLRFNFPDY